jgi:methyltransferase-like protein 23
VIPRQDVTNLDRLGSVLSATPIVVGRREWRIWCVQNQDQLLSLADGLAHLPYGLLLWESAVALAQHLVQVPALVANKRVLELGAGVGLPGLVARTLGAEVWQTDRLEEAITLAELNARENDVGGVHRFCGDWEQWTDERRYDVILGADILYETAAHAALAAIVDSRVAPQGRVLFADPGRPQALAFLAKLENQGARFEVEVRTVPPTCFLSSREDMEVILVERKTAGWS